MPYKPYRNEATRSSIISALRDTEAQAAWGRFFDTYAGFVFGIARNMGLSEPDADETVQVVMSELARGGASTRYDKALGPFRGWLTRLARWRARNIMMQNVRREQIQETASDLSALADHETNPELERAIGDEWIKAVTDAALERLRGEVSQLHFQIYYASAIEQLDAADVARLYGVSANNLYQIRRRVGARFRVLVDEAMRDMDNPDFPPRSQDGR